MADDTPPAVLPPSADRARVLTDTAAHIAVHGATPAQAAAMAEISRILSEADDPAALAGRVLARIAAEKSKESCAVHAWCAETGVHEWHNSKSVQVAQDCDFAVSGRHDHTTGPYIDAKLISEDDRETGELGAGAAIAFGECEVTADGMRDEVAKIRAAIPRLLAMADTLDGTPAYAVPTDCHEAARVTAPGARGAVLNPG